MKPHDPLAMAGMVHDLNNVLQTLVGVALQSEDLAASAAILRCVERARNILLENGPLLSLETIVNNAAEFVRDHGGAVVQVVCEAESGLPHLSAVWERVLINLFLNSQRAMQDGGCIRVTARVIGDAERIVISDEGPGIPAELLDHLFEPHVSGNGSSGLGLNIVRGIVAASGGSIRAANGERGGAEFTIVLPLAQRTRTVAAGL